MASKDQVTAEAVAKMLKTSTERVEAAQMSQSELQDAFNKSADGRRMGRQGSLVAFTGAIVLVGSMAAMMWGNAHVGASLTAYFAGGCAVIGGFVCGIQGDNKVTGVRHEIISKADENLWKAYRAQKAAAPGAAP